MASLNRRSGRIRLSVLLVAALVGIGIIASVLSLAAQRSGSGAPAAPPAPSPRREPAVPAVDTVALAGLLSSEALKIPGNVSLHVRFLTDEEAGYRAEEPQPAASIIKLPIMAALFDAWEQSVLPRTEADLEQIRLAMTQSDNPATNALIERLGQKRINEWLAGQDYSQTRVRHKILARRPEANTVSAAEMTRMLVDMGQGRLVSPFASEEMRRILEAQQRRTRIPALLPPDARVGNKTGTLRGITHDVALISPPGTPGYALAVLVSKGGSDVETSRAIARLSRRVYDFVVANGTPSPGEPAEK